MELPSTFKDFLTMIGSPIFIGVVLSVLLVRWAWFVNLTDKVKFWIVGGVSIILPIVSRALVLYLPTGAVDFIEQWYPTVIIGLGVWMSSQVWNKLFGANGAISRAPTIKQITAPTVQQTPTPAVKPKG